MTETNCIPPKCFLLGPAQFVKCLYLFEIFDMPDENNGKKKEQKMKFIQPIFITIYLSPSIFVVLVYCLKEPFPPL